MKNEYIFFELWKIRLVGGSNNEKFDLCKNILMKNFIFSMHVERRFLMENLIFRPRMKGKKL